MTQLMTLLRKDLARLWPVVVGLWAAIAIRLALAWRDPLYTEAALDSSLLIIIALILAAAWIVQQEPLVGSTAFWMTRPISRRILLAEKALLVAALVLLPAALGDVALLLRFGLPLERVPAAVFDSLVVLAPVLAGAFALASVTRGLGPYLAAWFASVLALSSGAQFAWELASPFVDQGMMPSRMVAMSLALTVMATGIAAYQYLGGRVWRSRFAVAAGLVAAIGVLTFWNRDIAFWQGPLAEGARLELTPVGRDPAFLVRRAGRDGLSIAGKGAVSGLDDAELVDISFIRGTLEAGGAGVFPILGGTARDRARVPAALGEGWRLDGRRSGSVSLRLPAARFEELIEETPAVRGEARGIRYRSRLVGALPLIEGATLDGGPVAAVVKGVSVADDGLELELHVRGIGFEATPGRLPETLLIHRERREIAVRSSFGETGGVASQRRTLSGANVNSWTQTHFYEFTGGPARPALDEDWIAGAELAVIEWIPVGRVSAEFAAEAMALRENPRRRRRQSQQDGI